MNRAAFLFDWLSAEGEKAIDELIHNRKSEELFLDFKRSADEGRGARLNQKDRATLARALSGFANSEGGVIVWGVDCRPGKDGADIPHSKVPLVDSAAFVSWLEGAVSGCTVPPCPGVRSISIRSDGDSGFAVTLVPKSSRAPHQEVGSGRYYIRAGSDFLPTPHGVLAGLFGQRPEPFVFHQYSVKPVEMVESGRIIARVGIVLVSDGPGIARDPFVTLDILAPRSPSVIRLDWTNENLFDCYTEIGGNISFVGKESFRLPPGGQVTPFWLFMALEPPFQRSLFISMNYGCSGAATRQIQVSHTSAELKKICSAVNKSPDKKRTETFMRLFFGEPIMPAERPLVVEDR